MAHDIHLPALARVSVRERLYEHIDNNSNANATTRWQCLS